MPLGSFLYVPANLSKTRKTIGTQGGPFDRLMTPTTIQSPTKPCYLDYFSAVTFELYQALLRKCYKRLPAIKSLISEGLL